MSFVDKRKMWLLLLVRYTSWTLQLRLFTCDFHLGYRCQGMSTTQLLVSKLEVSTLRCSHNCILEILSCLLENVFTPNSIRMPSIVHHDEIIVFFCEKINNCIKSNIHWFIITQNFDVECLVDVQNFVPLKTVCQQVLLVKVRSRVKHLTR